MTKTKTAFNDTRRDIGKQLRKSIRHVNRLLARALDAGVMVTIWTDGHPRYDVGTYSGLGTGESACADWALRLKAVVSTKRHPKGGDTFGPVPYCDWPNPFYGTSREAGRSHE